MQIFVYEFVTGGGLWSLGDAPPAGSMLAEGSAMSEAVAADFREAGHDVRRLHDARLPKIPSADAWPISSATEERTHFARLSAEADWTLVIAPESDGILLERCRWVRACGGRLLSPGEELVALASDKCLAADCLGRHGVPAPPGIRIESGLARVCADAIIYPAVFKPNDGCGSQGIRLLSEPAECKEEAITGTMRLERFIPGQAASVALLCGPGVFIPLPACEQRLSRDGRFTYLGGRLPLPADLDRRAQRLAVAAVQTLPAPLGYMGVDLVLGNDPDGHEDCVIEINPRLTTSYVGLRALCASNLAAAMISTALGDAPTLSWHGGVVEFAADGTVTTMNDKPQEELAR